MPRHRWWGLAVCLVMALSAPPAPAQFLARQVNLAYLAQRADIIVQGRVVEARYEGHPDYPHVRTVFVTLEVERTLRGPAGGRFAFRQLLSSREAYGGKRGYLAGQRLLLFLPLPSRYGLSSPIGNEQGRFHISRDAQGRDLVANELGNAGLLRGVRETAERAGVGLTERQSRLAAVRRGPASLDDFSGLVQRLMLLPRIP